MVLAAMGKAGFRFRVGVGKPGKFADPCGTRVARSSAFGRSLALNGACKVLVVLNT